MRIIEKYVLKSYLSALVFCVLLLIILGVIGDVLGFIDDIFKNDIPLSSILSFYFYLAPFAFVNMLPFAAILSASYVFNSLSKSHEVTAVIASGLSLWEMLRPVAVATFVLCVATFIINDRIVPPTMQKANIVKHRELESGGDRDRTGHENIALYGKGEQIIFARSFSPETDTLRNVIIHKQGAGHIIKEKISARLVKYGNGRWMGQDVMTFKVDPGGGFKGDPEVNKRQIIDIREKPEDFIINQWDPRMMSYSRLKQYMRLFRRASPDTIRRFRVDLHYKLAFPFTALIMILICVPFSIETGRANALVGMVRGVSISILYVPVMAVSLALGKGGYMPPVVSAWLTNAVFLALGIYFIYRKS
jgi:lipopolysaccharide export system permease protein